MDPEKTYIGTVSHDKSIGGMAHVEKRFGWMMVYGRQSRGVDGDEGYDRGRMRSPYGTPL